EEVIEPAVKGTLNVLKACVESNVKRVVVVSSVTAVSLNPRWPVGQIKDEACWSDKEYCAATKNWYCLSKTEAESEAFEFAKKSGLDVVTVCPTVILGPLLQSTINASSKSIVAGARTLFYISCLPTMVFQQKLRGKYEGYDTLENKLRKIVDVRDVAQALLLVYEKPAAEGRYICTAHTIKAHDLVDKLRSMFPQYNYPKSFTAGGEEDTVSSEKLQRLGWSYRPLEETLVDSIESYKKAGILD
ncbi:hypothetical protein Gotri_010925, partial [Gossypium trilobum]|nr:hypothetical protein [Gossypium trilobum]